MKQRYTKLKSVALAALTMGLALGAEAEEKSFDICLTEDFAVYGIPLVTGSESATTMKLNELVWYGLQGVDFDSEDDFMATATQIQVPIERDGKILGYNVYYYLNDAWSEEYETTMEGWADACGDYADVEISPAMGVWIKSPDAPDDTFVTVRGYPLAETVSMPCPEGTFVLRANPFAEAIDLNDSSRCVAEGITAVSYGDGGFVDTASFIEVESGERYYYLDDAMDEYEELVCGWANDSGDVAGTLPAGAGFWVKGRTGAFNLTFKPQ